MLNNIIKILLVSFVHHIELQNFLNAPRKYKRQGLCEVVCQPEIMTSYSQLA